MTTRTSVRRAGPLAMCRRWLGLAAGIIGSAAFGLSVLPGSALAAWPEKPIRFVVPFAAGGPADQVARLISAPLGEKLGGTVFIENKGGAGGNIGIAAAAKADPDGYTFLLTSGAFTLNPAIYEKVPYDAVADFEPVFEVSSSPTVFTALPSLGVSSIADLVAMAKREPDKLNYASPGAGTQGHLAAEMLKAREGINMVHVNHPGAGPAMQSLLAGTVPIGASSLPPTHPHIKAGTLKGLAVTGTQRWHDLPEIPTMLELGYKDFVVEVNFVLYAPARTPKDIVARLARECAEIVARPDVSEKLKGAGFVVTALDPEALRAKTIRELAFWKAVVAEAGIKPR